MDESSRGDRQSAQDLLDGSERRDRRARMSPGGEGPVDEDGNGTVWTGKGVALTDEAIVAAAAATADADANTDMEAGDVSCAPAFTQSPLSESDKGDDGDSRNSVMAAQEAPGWPSVAAMARSIEADAVRCRIGEESLGFELRFEASPDPDPDADTFLSQLAKFSVLFVSDGGSGEDRDIGDASTLPGPGNSTLVTSSSPLSESECNDPAARGDPEEVDSVDSVGNGKEASPSPVDEDRAKAEAGTGEPRREGDDSMSSMSRSSTLSPLLKSLPLLSLPSIIDSS